MFWSSGACHYPTVPQHEESAMYDCDTSTSNPLFIFCDFAIIYTLRLVTCLRIPTFPRSSNQAPLGSWSGTVQLWCKCKIWHPQAKLWRFEAKMLFLQGYVQDLTAFRIRTNFWNETRITPLGYIFRWAPRRMLNLTISFLYSAWARFRGQKFKEFQISSHSIVVCTKLH